MTADQRRAAEALVEAARRHADQDDAELWHDADFLRDKIARWQTEIAK